MNPTRRGFLGAMLAAAAAPAIVKADSLMKVVVPKHVADGHFITMYGYKIGNGPTTFKSDVVDAYTRGDCLQQQYVDVIERVMLDEDRGPLILGELGYMEGFTVVVSEIDKSNVVFDRGVTQPMFLGAKRGPKPARRLGRNQIESLFDKARDLAYLKIRG